MKYAIVKQKNDIYDEGIVCIFSNVGQREKNEFTSLRRYINLCSFRNLKYLDLDFTEIPARDARKIMRHAGMVFNFTIDVNENTSVKAWYTSEYINDDLGHEIPGNIKFIDIFKALEAHKDIYRLLNAADSIIRERVFNKLAEILKVDYDYIYDLWLDD